MTGAQGVGRLLPTASIVLAFGPAPLALPSKTLPGAALSPSSIGPIHNAPSCP